MNLRPMCRRVLGLIACLGLTAPSVAQPTGFIDVGTFAAPATPAYASTFVDESDVFSTADLPIVLGVQWVRFALSGPIQGDLYLDMDARVYTPGSFLTFALFDSAGNLIAADDSSGGFPLGQAPGLSFGSMAERVPFASQSLRGQHGSSLSAGTYYLAIAAGSLAQVTFGPNWTVNTSASVTIGFDDGETFVETGFYVGNTTPPPVPANDSCFNAVTIGENVGSTPAWTGTNVGATQDGFSLCYPDLFNVTIKDVWVNYVPTVTGWAEVFATGGAGGAAVPILTQYDSNGCGGAPVRCAGGGSFLATGGTRLAFRVEAGVPVLLGVAVRAGAWGPLTLNVRAFAEGCALTVPAGAVQEIETSCGESGNDSCATPVAESDTIQVGQTVTGSIYSEAGFRDIDRFRFTLIEPMTVRLTGRAQMPVTMQIRRTCGSTTQLTLQNLSLADGCVPLTGTASLAAGDYAVSITPTYADGMTCADLFQGYWLTLEDVNCDRAWFSQQPLSTEVCPGGEAVLSVQTGGPAPASYLWEWRASATGTGAWTPLADGVFPLGGSAAVLTGTGTSSITISGADAAVAGAFRVTATTCGPARSAAAVLTVLAQDAPACDAPTPCPGNYNGDASVDLLDLLAFNADWSSNLGQNVAPGTNGDYNASGSVDLLDLLAFNAEWSSNLGQPCP